MKRELKYVHTKLLECYYTTKSIHYSICIKMLNYTWAIFILQKRDAYMFIQLYQKLVIYFFAVLLWGLWLTAEILKSNLYKYWTALSLFSQGTMLMIYKTLVRQTVLTRVQTKCNLTVLSLRFIMTKIS